MKKIDMKNIKMGQIKFSPRVLQIVCGVIVILAIGAYAYMGYMYSDELGKQDDLESELDDANEKWARVKDRPVEDLESILEQTKQELEEEESIFPVELSANDVMQLLLQAAEEHGLNILPLTGIRPADTENVLGNKYWKVDFNLRPSGTLPQLLGFLEAMEQGEIGGERYATMTLSDVQVSGKGGKWQLGFKGSIYSRMEETTEAES